MEALTGPQLSFTTEPLVERIWTCCMKESTVRRVGKSAVFTLDLKLHTSRQDRYGPRILNSFKAFNRLSVLRTRRSISRIHFA